MKRQGSDRVYIILGTGRSATSWLSNAINEQCGTMWESANSHNEDDAFKEMNTQILKQAGGDPYNIPAQEAIDATMPMFQDRVKQLIESRKEKYDEWGWKDPKTVFTIDHYLPHLKDDDVYFFYSLRKLSWVVDDLTTFVKWTDEKTAKRVVRRYKKRLMELVERIDDI